MNPLRRMVLKEGWPEFVYAIADTFLRLKSRLTGTGYPLHRNESFRPFFIVGAPRSGNTLLRRILTASPEIHIPPETYVLGQVIRTFRRQRHRDWPYVVGSVLALFEYHPHFDQFGLSLRPLFERLMAAPLETRSLAHILDSFYRYDAESLGKTCSLWGDKTPLNVYYLRQIHRVYPRARFIHILRDGVDSTYSMLRMPKPKFDLEQAATRWKTSVSAARSFARRNPALCHEVRYEELVADPQAITKRLCDWLETPFQPSMVDSIAHEGLLRDTKTYHHHAHVLNPITTASIGKGRRELTLEQRTKLQRLIGAHLRRLGYEACA